MRQSILASPLIFCTMFVAPTTALAEWDGVYVALGTKMVSGHSPEFEDEDVDLSFHTIIGTALAGYNFQFGNVVVGLETGLDKGGESVHEDRYYNFEYSSVNYVSARLGYDMGRYMPYAKYSQLNMGFEFSVDYPMFSDVNVKDSLKGNAYGIGMDFALKGKGFARIELERREFLAEDLDFGSGFEIRFDGQLMDTVTAAVGLQF